MRGYALTDDQALRASYFQSILRPAFADFIPYPDATVDDPYETVGNPYLQHTVIDNYDLRYEFFPGVFDEFMAGAFYKYLINPIETVLSPGQSGAALFLEPESGQVAAITDENDWSVTLDAEYNFTGKNAGTVTPGVGNVTFNNGPGTSGCSIQTAQGNITVLAGNNVTVGAGGIVTGIDAAAGKVITGPGGNINVQAVAGNVNCGTSKVGYDFTQNGYAVDPGLGGISTASGGNVTIQAGGNITAAMPGTVATDYGSGAFGANPGNVSLTAGGNVVGHYVLGNGTGTSRPGTRESAVRT